MYIAVEGCGHGELDGIYAAIQHVERVRSIKVDLLIICGDFQATRNTDDLQCMAVPPKYYTMGTFYKYYCGELTAPVLTLVVGGNHEASNYMQSLAYGGWLAPNIYFVGYATVLRFGSLRVGALSGIYNGHDYLKGHHERPPYDRSTMRSAYHVRNVDTYRLKQLTPEMDIFISHDWPRGIYHHGNVDQLLSKKPFFREEVETNKLGSRPAEEILKKLQPRFWFAAHLHVKFSALVQHAEPAAADDAPPAPSAPAQLAANDVPSALSAPAQPAAGDAPPAPSAPAQPAANDAPAAPSAPAQPAADDAPAAPSAPAQPAANDAPPAPSAPAQPTADDAPAAPAQPAADDAATKEGTGADDVTDGVSAGNSVDKDNGNESPPVGRVTRFLALDKCLPRRKYMQVLELGDGRPELSYDLEWLTVLRLTDHLTSVTSATQYMPGPGCNQRYDFRPSAEELAATTAAWGDDLRVPVDFAPTVTPYDGKSDIRGGRQPAAATDPQTKRFCDRLAVRDPMQMLCGDAPPAPTYVAPRSNPEESDVTIDNDVTLDPDGEVTADPAEIALDDDDDDCGGGDMFVIDRRGTGAADRSPAMTFPEFNMAASTPVKLAAASAGVTPGPKKFKRRNQAIYGAESEE